MTAIEPILLGVILTMGGATLAFVIRLESRLTRLETKLEDLPCKNNSHPIKPC
jgi:hypothetical protein